MVRPYVWSITGACISDAVSLDLQWRNEERAYELEEEKRKKKQER